MKTSRALSLTCLFISLTAAAQAPGKRLFSADSRLAAAITSSCPVRIEARNVTKPRLLLTSAADSKGAFQDLRIELNNPSATAIVLAQITVRGFTGQHSAMPLLTIGDGARNPAEVKKSIDLDLKVEPGAGASTEVHLSRFTGIVAVELASVTYVDGTVWKHGEEQGCEVTPGSVL